MKTEPSDSMHPVTDSVLIGHEGLTKREYFAAMAMQGILANPNNRMSPRVSAETAVLAANELINQLNNNQNNHT